MSLDSYTWKKRNWNCLLSREASKLKQDLYNGACHCREKESAISELISLVLFSPYTFSFPLTPANSGISLVRRKKECYMCLKIFRRHAIVKYQPESLEEKLVSLEQGRHWFTANWGCQMVCKATQIPDSLPLLQWRMKAK